jgi:hypothetical protein
MWLRAMESVQAREKGRSSLSMMMCSRLEEEGKRPMLRRRVCAQALTRSVLSQVLPNVAIAAFK